MIVRLAGIIKIQNNPLVKISRSVPSGSGVRPTSREEKLNGKIEAIEWAFDGSPGGIKGIRGG